MSSARTIQAEPVSRNNKHHDATIIDDTGIHEFIGHFLRFLWNYPRIYATMNAINTYKDLTMQIASSIEYHRTIPRPSRRAKLRPALMRHVREPDCLMVDWAPGGPRLVDPHELASAMSDALVVMYEVSDGYLHGNLEDWLECQEIETFHDAYEYIENIINSTSPEHLSGEAWYYLYNAIDAGQLAIPLCASCRLSDRRLHKLFRSALGLPA